MTSVNPHLYLDPEQQDLLLAALASNSSPMFLSEGSHQQLNQYQPLDSINNYGSSSHNTQNQQSGTPASVGSHKMDTTGPNNGVDFQTPMTELNGVSPVLDGLDYTFDLDGSYDWEGMGEEYGASADGSIDTPTTAITEHEKRKSPPTDNEDGSPGSDTRQNEPKRREKETDEKVAKKPGRKPLTSEPTSKRKAQNRAAQRAFRERKEKHLKDLEQKVADLEKASETVNKENSALRQQIERLQSELNEYRKRLNDKSSVSSILGKGTNGGFQFEFPLFGMKTPSHLSIGSNTKPGQFTQPNNAMNGMRFDIGSQGGRARSSTTPSSIASTIRPPNSSTTVDSSQFTNTPHTAQEHAQTGFSNYYTPSSRESTSDYLPDGSRIPKADSTTSPSSTLSQLGTNSSVTSPESNTHSPLSYKPDQLEPVTEEIVQVLSSEHDEPGFHCGVLDDGETSFCEKLGAIACGNPRNPVPLAPDSKLLPNLNEVIPRPDPRRNSNNMNALTHQIGSGFDPVLFGDYRDPMDQANMDLNMSFFDDAFPMADFSLGSPIIPGTPVGEKAEPELKKPAPSGLENPEDDYSSSEDEAFMVHAKPDTNLMSCNKIWDRISAHPKFASGELDMDNLCSELRSKAKCSETGVVVGQKDVEEVLSKAGLKPRDLGITTK